jgi:hypothetical protein
MAQPTMQKSFNSGEWAPQLYSRVDIEKYHSGAALLRNFFVDYRGGASTRTGTKYVLQAYKSSTTVRLIPFQASFRVSYILEFGDQYIRFYNQGAPVLEAEVAISHVHNNNPLVVDVTNSYAVGDWVFISGVVGTTQVNGNYYSILAATGSSVTLGDLNGNAIDGSGYSPYVSGGSIARVYTIPSSYAAADLPLIKYAQNINQLILCHPSYPPATLTLVAANNWILGNIPFGTSATIPSGLTASTTLAGGQVNYSYVVTSVDSLGDESIASNPVYIPSKLDLRTTAGSNSISWSPVSGAVSYNVYKSDVSYFGTVPAGVPYGFIGNVTGNSIVDSNISPDFSSTPPIGQNPFTGAAVASIAQTSTGTYGTVPSVIFTGGSPNASAVASAILGVIGTPTVGAGGSGYAVNDFITLTQGVIVKVASVSGGVITSFQPIGTAGCSPGSVTSGGTPTNPTGQISTTGGGSGATVTLVWGVIQTLLVNGGQGYASTPAISYSPSGASATATLSAFSNSYPAVPGFFQQRLILAAAVNGPQTMNFSQPGSYFNYNISNPIEPDDAIEVTLASGVLNEIQSLLPTAPGLIVFTDKASWLVNGGSLGSSISPSAIVANLQSANGANDVPPILNNYDILFIESKGSVVRDSTYNYYAQVFTGTDISVVSSHLFYGYQITEWAWAQEPFKLVWAIRNDGTMLTLTFAKEQEFIAWTHHDTQGLFQSVATGVEATEDSVGFLDAIYTVVERVINGNTVKYIERVAERIFTNGVTDAWCVDAAIRYDGTATLAFQGAIQLAAATVIGLATDDLGNVTVITPFVMPTTGSFTLPAPALPAVGYTRVTIGLPFLPQLQTLPIDTGEPTIQGKMKKISAVTVRVTDTLGLQIGSDFNNLVNMKDLIVGQVGSSTNQVVTNLVDGDAQQIVDPKWATQGQFCIQQSLPYPATITGVMPELTVGDTR